MPDAPASGAAAPRPPRDVVAREREAAKEAKRLAKEAKQARRGTDGGAAGAPGAAAGPSSRGKAPAAAQTVQQGAAASSSAAKKDATSKPSPSGAAPAPAPVEAAPTSVPRLPPARVAPMFSNVWAPRSGPLDSLASSLRAGLHPSVVTLAQHLANFSIVGADARAIAVLRALRDVVADYRTPDGAVLSRDLVQRLAPQIAALAQARPLGASVEHAIRFLKYEISVTPVESSESEAREHILFVIDHFIRDRITHAARAIATTVAADKIRPEGEVVLTFGRSSVVEAALLEAWRKGSRFEVLVVDAQPLCEGRRLLATLLAHDIPCSYALLTSLPSLMPRATLVLLGTAAVLANGALYSRAGTAAVAMLAHERQVPVVVACQTYKFSERLVLDALSSNEAGDPTTMLAHGDAPAAPPVPAPDAEAHARLTHAEVLRTPNLALASPLYDTTPPRFVGGICSEAGVHKPEAVAELLLDYKRGPYMNQ